MNILIIEDDCFFAEHLKKAFQKNSLVNRVDIVHSFSEFLCMFSLIEGYDIILTDIHLAPNTSGNPYDGFHIIQSIREAGITIPIIVISGRDDISKIQNAFTIGANDYIVKGVRMRELEIRVMHWFKYYHMEGKSSCTDNVYMYKKICFDVDRNEFFFEDSLISLTKTNKYIFSLFFVNAEKLLSEPFLTGKVWGDICFDTRRNIRIHILRLRRSLQPFSLHTWIRNIRGEGYIFIENNSSKDSLL
ncbi:MAG: response regulator transcription factor [Candidatus Gracilibacteria bacterium]|nr:response regulator transcription factor [Candidatus Gracilibacteria bacterium]